MKPHGNKGRRHAAKDNPRSAQIYVVCKEVDKVRWQAAAALRRESLTTFVARVMNTAAEGATSAEGPGAPAKTYTENGGDTVLRMRVYPTEKAAWGALAGLLGKNMTECVKSILNTEAARVLALK